MRVKTFLLIAGAAALIGALSLSGGIDVPRDGPRESGAPACLRTGGVPLVHWFGSTDCSEENLYDRVWRATRLPGSPKPPTARQQLRLSLTVASTIGTARPDLRTNPLRPSLIGGPLTRVMYGCVRGQVLEFLREEESSQYALDETKGVISLGGWLAGRAASAAVANTDLEEAWTVGRRAVSNAKTALGTDPFTAVLDTMARGVLAIRSMEQDYADDFNISVCVVGA